MTLADYSLIISAVSIAVSLASLALSVATLRRDRGPR